jgi:hypothetical protein
MTEPLAAILPRSVRERERLRQKRADPDYLKRQRARRAAQMAKDRAARRKIGQCWDCKKKAMDGHIYCRAHLAYERARKTKS